MAEVRRFRAPKTIAAAQHMLALFGAQFPGKCIQNITREDLLDHMAALQERGLGQRTIYNHIARIGTLLRSHKVVGLLDAKDKPKYDEREVAAYDSDQIHALFAAANAEERMTFQFFLGTGFRCRTVEAGNGLQAKGQGRAVGSRP